MIRRKDAFFAGIRKVFYRRAGKYHNMLCNNAARTKLKHKTFPTGKAVPRSFAPDQVQCNHKSLRPRQSTTREVSPARRCLCQGSDRARSHLTCDMIGLTDRQRHDGQRRIFRSPGGELAAVRDEQVGNVMRLAPFVDHPQLGIF